MKTQTKPPQPIKELGTYCCYKISAMKVAYTNDRIEKCRNCSGVLEYILDMGKLELKPTCENYFPLYRTGESFRRGRNACLNI